MIRGIEQLQHEHDILRAKLALLENALRVGPEACFAIRELVYTISRRLAEHEEREEVQLYPLLHETLPEAEDQFARSLAVQHEEHQSLLRALHRLTLRGMRMPLMTVADLVQQLTASLREHMAREERLLFPIAARLEADREANAQATAQRADTLHASTTVNRILGLYPEAKRVFVDHCVDLRWEGHDFLDEIAWRHAVPVEELLRQLRRRACWRRSHDEEPVEGVHD